MALAIWTKMETAAARYFTTRRKWKTLQYSVYVLSVFFLLMATVLPWGALRERSRVLGAMGGWGSGLPKTAEGMKKILPQGTPSGKLSPAEVTPSGQAGYVLFRNGQAVAQAGIAGQVDWPLERSLSALSGYLKNEGGLHGMEPGVPARARFFPLEGIPAWVTSLPLSDGRLVLYRTFPWVVGYAWVLFFSLILLTALALPLMVRKVQLRIQTIPDLLRRQIILYTFVSLLPAGLLCVVFAATAFAGQVIGIRWIVSPWALLALICGFLALAVWSVYVAARDMNHRINDALLVITNGMEMASNLDFDHPIIPVTHDEIGLVAEVFNQVNHVLKTRVNILQALFNSVRVFSGLTHREQILEHTVKTFRSLAETGEIVVALLDEEAGELVVEKTMSGRPESARLRFSKNEGLPGRILVEQQMVYLTGEEYGEISGKSEKERLLWGKPDSVLCIPMLFKGGFKGAVIFYDMKSADFQLETKRDYLIGLANQIAIFLENTRLYSLVIRDRLTGLFVHSFLEAHLENLLAQAKRYKFPVTFVMLDVDKFKNINDAFGHPIGNRLLKAVGLAIHSASRNADLKGRPSSAETPMGISRESDMGGRFGGDEFEIILPHTDKEGGLIYADRLRKTVEAIKVEVSSGVTASVTLSIGLATYPQDGLDAAQLQASADKALYVAKGQGRNRVVAYKAEESKSAP